LLNSTKTVANGTQSVAGDAASARGSVRPILCLSPFPMACGGSFAVKILGSHLPARIPRDLACTMAWTVAWLALGAGSASAQVNTGSSSEISLLTELLALILLGRLLGEAMQRVGQPSVMGELLAGILLGPSVLGLVWPDFQHWLFPAAKEQKAMLDAVSNFGILLLLLLTGMETDLKLVRKFGRAALSVSLSGVALPFICGAALGALMPDSLLPGTDKRLLTALFLGTALSISSIKIVAAVVRDMNFTRRNLGQVIISSSIMEDTIGWIIISITFGLASAATIDIAGVAKSIVGTAIFLIASFTVGRRLVFLAIKFVNDNFESEFAVVTAILAIMVAMALTTNLIGVNTVLGRIHGRGVDRPIADPH
jgi:Kef-type K+ transport system membrane component KefB